MLNDINLSNTNQNINLENNPTQKIEVEKISTAYTAKSNNDRNTVQASFVFARYNTPQDTKVVQLEVDKDCNFSVAIPYDTKSINDNDFNTIGDTIIYHPQNNTTIITKANGDMFIKTDTQKITMSNNGIFQIEANGSSVFINANGEAGAKRGNTSIVVTANSKIKFTNQVGSFFTMWNTVTASRIAFYNALSTALNLNTYNAFRASLNPQITGFINTENSVLTTFNNLFEI